MALAKSEDERRLLSILESHGQTFLQSFGLPDKKGKKRKREEPTPLVTEPLADEDSEEEWGGIEDAESTSELEDDALETLIPSAAVDTVVFSDSSLKAGAQKLSKAQMKTFMSSKVSKLSENVDKRIETPNTEEEDDDRTNAENDAMLHRLVHTQLLSGSLNTELEMTPAQRRKAMEGRILELSGKAKLGKGEKSVRAHERNRASKRVRDGLVDKVDERRKQELAKAKELGNYHPMFKKLYEDESGQSVKKRERGLKMGVGTFSGGMLKLSRHDIAKAPGARAGRRK